MPSSRIAIAAALVATAALGTSVAEATPAPAPATAASPAIASTSLGPAHAARPPLAVIARPRAGATVSGTLRPGLRIRGAAAVTRLELLVDGTLVDRWFPRRAKAPRWRTSRVANGPHTLTVRTVGAPRGRSSSGPVRGRNGTSRSGTRRSGATPPAPAAAAPVAAPPPSANGLDIPGVVLRT